MKDRPTAVYSTRTDLRVLAALAHYWQSQGLEVKSISELHRTTIEAFVQILQNRGLARTFGTTMEARNFLEDQNLLKSLSPRNRSTLIKTLQTEELLAQDIDPSYIEKKGTTTMSEDQVQKAQEILKRRLEKDSCEGSILGPLPGEMEE